MKRAIGLAAVIALGIVALYLSQRRKEPLPVTATTLVNTVADVQRDVTRIPMHFARMSDEQEIAIGKELANCYKTDSNRLDAKQKALELYVKRVGLIVSAHAKRKLPYQFHLVPGPHLIDAFALPGGQVFIGQAMLDLMTTEDELANVLGHEIEHIDHYHAAERVQVETRLRNLHVGVLAELAQLPVTIWEIGYSKDQEMEADGEGMLLAATAGYSPYGAVQAFNRLAQFHEEYVIKAKNPAQELSSLAIESLTGYFRSHPLPSERLAAANRLIAERQWSGRKQQKPFQAEREGKPQTTAGT